MPKRKREADDADASTSTDHTAQEQRVRQKLDQATSKLTQAFKIAKGFERQKLGRRQKKAQGQDQSRIVAEVDALKTLDVSLSVQHFLFKSLNKVKVISASEILPKVLPISTPLPSDTAAHNVHARLCGSQPVKDAFSGVIKEVLQAGRFDAAKNAGKTELKKESESRIAAEVDDDDDFGFDSEPSNSVENEELGFDESEDEYDKFAHRLASSGEDSESDGDMSVNGEDDLDEDELERQLAIEGVKRRLSVSEDDPSELDEPNPAPRKSKSAAKTKLPTSSTLIPSLTMGGYLSASDGSEAEELDVAPRKNKRGQRARQAIWEKKYGAKAKHLKSGKPGRDAGWDPKRGAVSGRGSGFRKIAGDGRGQRDLSQAKPAPQKSHKDDEGPIHPSWEAAKRAKEKSAAVPAFSGKKITFD